MTRKLIQTLLAVAALSAPLFATTIQKMDLPELVKLSDTIAQGTVQSTESRWEDQAIYTYITIRVDEGLKGAPRRAVLIRQAGGRVGGMNLDVPGTPQFKPGDQVIVFLRDRKNGTFDVVGLSQGKYDIQGDAAITNVSGASLVDPKTGQLMEGGSVDRKPLDALKAKIRELAR